MTTENYKLDRIDEIVKELESMTNLDWTITQRVNLNMVCRALRNTLNNKTFKE